jgi:hypothetical protein
MFAHNVQRNPRINAANFVFVNNVVYNPGDATMMLFNNDGHTTSNSIVGNVFVAGADTVRNLMPIRLMGPNDGNGLNDVLPGTRIYLHDNKAWSTVSDQWDLVHNQSSVATSALKVSSPPTWPAGLNAMPNSGNNVFNSVTTNVGSRPAQRDSVDSRVIADIRSGSGQVINCVANDGTSRCSKNAGGWPTAVGPTRSLTLPSNPNGDSDGDGYTNLEEWLHSMAADVEGGSGSSPPPPPDEPAPPKPPELIN